MLSIKSQRLRYWFESESERMPCDDPILRELGGYFKAEEPGRRERADAWATAIGLQKVDGLTPSQFLFDTAKDHIEGRITQNQARRRIRDYYARLKRRRAEDATPCLDEDKQKIRELTEGRKKVVRKGWPEKGGQKTTQKTVVKTTQKTAARILGILSENPRSTRRDLALATGLTEDGVKWHLQQLKAAGRLRRVGPDKGGHWEVLKECKTEGMTIWRLT